MEKRERMIGVLALQGDFEAHGKTLTERLRLPTRMVRTREELEETDALILPGGESTTIAKLMARNGLDNAIRERVAAGMPLYGTCAGLILMAKTIEGRPDQPTLGVLDVVVARNAFGRQIDSFEANIEFAPVMEEDATPVRGVFIRAPYVTTAEPNVSILARFEEKIVAVRQGSLLGIAFHPELTDDARVHAYFAQMVAESEERRP